MKRIPFDIIINNIIPYTYNIQPKLLLEDIKNYYEIKIKLINDKYDIYIIKNEILAIFYNDKQKLKNILYRHFQVNLKKKDYNIIYQYPQNIQFNILFGLFSKEERNYFSEYILNDLRIWIIK
jgi:hypothetical protein